MAKNTQIHSPQSIRLTSELCFFLHPPELGEEVRQHLTLRRDGSGILSRFVVGEAHPYKLMERRKINIPKEEATSIIDALAAAFSNDAEMLLVTDVGMWCLTFQDANGLKHRFEGSLFPDEGFFSQVSEQLRTQLAIPQLYAFDGVNEDGLVV